MLNMDFSCDLAAALVDLGEHEQALTLTVNAIEQQQRVGKFLHMPALFRMKGLILASRSAEDCSEAEGSLLSAIDWAKRQSATLFELKAATDLAELLLKQDRVPEAYKQLSAAFGRTPAGNIYRDRRACPGSPQPTPIRRAKAPIGSKRDALTTLRRLRSRVQVLAFRYKPGACRRGMLCAGMVTAGFECDARCGGVAPHRICACSMSVVERRCHGLTEIAQITGAIGSCP